MTSDPLDKVLHLLKGVKECGNGHYEARCPGPIHGKGKDDQTPSLSVTAAPDGKVLIHCHAHCDIKDIVAAIGISLKDLFPQKRSQDTKPIPVGSVRDYYYSDLDGEVWIRSRAQRYKNAPKRVWREYKVGGEWTTPNAVERTGDAEAKQTIEHIRRRKIPPFHLHHVLKAKEIPEGILFVVEGEKDVLSLHIELGLLSFTNLGGAGAVDKLNLIALAAAIRGREVVILPDNDSAGEGWAEDMANACARCARSVRILRLPGLPEKGDVSDWIEAGGTREELVRLARDAPSYVPKSKSGGAPAAGGIKEGAAEGFGKEIRRLIKAIREGSERQQALAALATIIDFPKGYTETVDLLLHGNPATEDLRCLAEAVAEIVGRSRLLADCIEATDHVAIDEGTRLYVYTDGRYNNDGARWVGSRVKNLLLQ